ncbi:hypothetical protein [Chromobacterium sp. IRSSSOUMB001]|uniref:hypothetical protein n=1 Tax=Chromobacterium sp. IRSSSOUMB001 TaxID=2927123 RepID=UPI0020BFED77|nr:hypothetical protein [Chromobacterium sp. IRSSSOUMB001]
MQTFLIPIYFVKIVLLILLILLVNPYADWAVDYIILPLYKSGLDDTYRKATQYALSVVPPIIALVIDRLYERWYRKRQDKYSNIRNQLNQIQAAKQALLSSTQFLEQISETIERSEKRQAELEAQVEALQSASKESTEDLRKKLDAISLVSRRQEYWRTGFAFASGVASSLVASGIWTILQK